MLIDRLKSLGIFVECVRQSSFRGAARALDMTPSAVGYHIKQLEAELGQPLFYRSTRKLGLTDAGERLFASAEAMLGLAETGLRQAADPDAALQGRLRITLTSAMAQSPLAAGIAQFHRDHPQVALDLHYSDAWEDLIGGRFDLALRSGGLQDSNLKCRKLWDMPRVLVASPALLSDHPPLKAPEDLATIPWIRFAKMVGHRVLIGADGAEVHIPQAGNITVNNIEAMADFARAGIALASPPTHVVAHDLAAGRLVEVLADWRVAPIPVYAVWPGGAVDNPLTQRLLQSLITQLG
ncbi:LysR family transcriptional regulator [Phaeobacter sp. CNT1-3]|nr:LysR family transcriptional regulator [Phaeobacter sp. CNT1-3]